MKSSYKKHRFGEVFYRMTVTFQPVVAVEIGVLEGYSALHIAAGLRDLGHGHLDLYDLFEEFPYNHAVYDDIVTKFKDNPCVSVNKRDAFDVAQAYHPGSVGLLHVDIGNDGATVSRIMEQWDSRMVHGGIIMFEGGSEDRDQVEWMLKYNKTPIKPELEQNRIIKDKYVFATYLDFPGLTVLLKKR